MMLNLILGFITTDATILFSVCHILRFMQYKSAQSVAPIRLPYHKIKEFYNLAPEKYEFNTTMMKKAFLLMCLVIICCMKKNV